MNISDTTGTAMDIKKFGFFFLFLIIVLIAIKFYTIIYDFFPSIASGCVLAYLFHPVYLYFRRLTKSETLSAFMVIFIIIFLILIPIVLLVVVLQKQMDVLFQEQTISNARNTLNTIEKFIREKLSINITTNYVDDMLGQLVQRVMGAVQSALTFLGPKMIASFTRFVISTFLTIFLMYYLLIDSKKVISVFKDYFPISYENSDILLNEMGKYTKALIYGQLLIAMLQGTLGGLGFFLFDVGGAVFWGIVMMIASFIPYVGASVVWFPAAIVLLSKNAYFDAGGLFVWGVVVIGTVDNLIRPKLTGYIGKIHPVTVLLGVFIGIKEWGFIGIVIGPLLIYVLIILIRMFREEYLLE